MSSNTLVLTPEFDASLILFSEEDSSSITLVAAEDLTLNLAGVIGASSSTNLAYTASPTNGIVTSDTGTDATIPLADVTNAGLMAPAQVTQLAGLGTASTHAATDFDAAGAAAAAQAASEPVLGFTPEDSANKNASNGYLGLAGYMPLIFDDTGTISTELHGNATSSRRIELPDSDGTVALTSDLAPYVKTDGSTDITGPQTLQDSLTLYAGKEIFLSGGDPNHYIKYDVTLDGPRAIGYSGAAIGTVANPDAVKATDAGATVNGTLSATNLSGTNTGDQDLTGLVSKTTTVNGHALNANVTVTKSDVGLGNADNTSDATKNSAAATLSNKTIDGGTF